MPIGPGRMLSHYRLVEKIGEGGMGVVYRAEDTKLRRQVALKVLPPDLVADEERRLRFLREARTAAAVNHPNIATIHEIDESDGIVFLTMELIQGVSLRKQMGCRALPVDEALRIATCIAAGLEKAHKANIIHRDLKPDNIMVGPDGVVKILDFGLAKLHEERDEIQREKLSRMETVSGQITREGRILGTPAYMSPEQARGRKVDARSDLFALGTSLYEMVTGRAPFKGKTTTDLLSSIIRDQPVPVSQVSADVPAEFDAVIAKCLEKEPQDRYQHAEDLIVDLRRLRRTTDPDRPQFRTPSGPDQWSVRSIRNRKRYLALAAIVTIFVGALWIYRSIVDTVPPFSKGDRIIVADFDNQTDQPLIGSAVRDAMENMLSEESGSRYLSVVLGSAFNKLRSSAGVAPNVQIDQSVAERLCGEDRCSGYVVGEVTSEGGGYRIQARVFRPGYDKPITISTGHAADEGQILSAVHEVAMKLRRGVGESATQVDETYPPTTQSLEAYQSFAIANRGWSDGAWDQMIPAFEQAITLDPDFVEAYAYLAALYSTDGSPRESRRYALEAYRRSDRMPQKAQLEYEIYYLWSMHDYENYVEKLKLFQGLYPHEYWPPNRLWAIYIGEYDDPAASEPYARRAYELRADGELFIYLLRSLVAQAKTAEIESLIEEFRERGGSAAILAKAEYQLLVSRGDPYWQLLESFTNVYSAGNLPETWALNAWRHSLMLAGRFAESREVASKAWRASRHDRFVKGVFNSLLNQAWLSYRADGKTPAFTQEQLAPARNDITQIPGFATLTIDVGSAADLRTLIREHEEFERGNDSSFLKETLDYCRACLALSLDDAATTRSILEPMALNSTIARRHHALARSYEMLGLWDKAAASYEEAVSKPYFVKPPDVIWAVLDQYRLARVYEKLDRIDLARSWYERFTENWKTADPDIPELIDARNQLTLLQAEETSGAEKTSSGSASK